MATILYTRISEVKSRLQGKVEFTTDPNSETAMTEHLLRRLISEAEGEVELDLSPRYETPLVATVGEDFDSLPDRPTKELIRTLTELKSVIRVLETDFGMAGGAVDSEDYVGTSQTRYNKMVKKLIKRKNDDEDQNQWFYPPLPGLKVAYFNTEADDGFRGMVLTTNAEAGGMDYPADRINDPSSSFFTVHTKDVIDDSGIL